MAGDFSIKIDIDSKEFDQFLRKFPIAAKRAIDKSLKKAALLVQNKAKRLSPYMRGDLRRSITNIPKGEAIRLVGTDKIYARVREFNTKAKPDGYLRPALANSADAIRRIFQDNIRKAINKS